METRRDLRKVLRFNVLQTNGANGRRFHFNLSARRRLLHRYLQQQSYIFRRYDGN